MLCGGTRPGPNDSSLTANLRVLLRAARDEPMTNSNSELQEGMAF
jgi:hypothetical protein